MMLYRPAPRHTREAIRQHAGMYVADPSSPRGFHHMLDLVVSQLTRQLSPAHPLGPADLRVRVWPDRYELRLDAQRPATPLADTFDWLHAVDALSASFHAEVTHDPSHALPFRHLVRCIPDPTIFTGAFDPHTTIERARQLAALSELRITLEWPDTSPIRLDAYTCADHLNHLRHTTASPPAPLLTLDTHTPVEDGTLHVQLVAQPAADAQGVHHSFVNTIPTRGGVHLDGARDGLLERGLDPDALDLLIHVRHPAPHFANPVREVLQNPEVAPAVCKLVGLAPVIA